MAIPDYQTIMLPLLRFASDEQEHSLREAIEHLADEFRLTAEERRSLLPSGGQPNFDNRVGWASTYLRKALLLEPTRRGYFRITERGKQTLGKNLERLTIGFLEQFKEFQDFRRRKPKASGSPQAEAVTLEPPTEQTPEEALEAAYQQLREDLAAELLQMVRQCSPKFFEFLVIDLLVKMGYGGSRKEAGEAVGGSGDEGIDGIIKEDRLGLDIIYIQAKRWQTTVGRPEIQKFAGALQGQRAHTQGHLHHHLGLLKECPGVCQLY